ncbi:CYTOCHROME P450 FAMILY MONOOXYGENASE [Salix koriyanagi]|uniref:CYTOCHROME P450 FAMILY MONOOXYGENASE n=1 Tax=Salix koriyanagi TaxID=2511006 RepID=A0A9Q0ZLQ8_9ROSI|nr:CYTOCHROME P450 FAMILY MONOOXYGENASE [Salix koriyanagi]
MTDDKSTSNLESPNVPMEFYIDAACCPRQKSHCARHNPMDSLQFSPVLFTLLSLFVSIILLFPFRKKLPYPPGPKGYPIIGNMGMMDQLTHRGLARLSKQYGGLLHLQMGGLHVVAVSTPETAREVLHVQDIVFANRPANLAIVYLTYDRADMAFANYGPFWRQTRKICAMKLFSRKRAESWASVRDEVESTSRKAAFGSSSNEGQEEFMAILQEFSKLFGAFNVADFFPWLGWIHHAQDFKRRLARSRNSLDGFIDTIIDEHIITRKKTRESLDSKDENEEVDTDMVDELLAFYSEDASKNNFDESKPGTIKLSKDNIKALIMDVMFGGTETVASAIEWAIAELIKSPEDLKKVQQELVDVVGLNRKVHESDLEKLTYLKCAMKEALRLHPPIPLLLHEAAEDSVLNGYRVPARSRVMINAWAIGRDPNAWDDPDKFKPGRFLDGKAPDFKGKDFEFLAFGSGRRSCPGMQLGLYALEMAVAHLLHCFTWELPHGMKSDELDMNDVFGLTAPRAVRLVAVPTYRLNCPF